MASTDTHIDIGIVVRDIDACLPFYRDVLGLPFVADFKIPGGSRMWQLACGPCIVKLVTHEPTPAAANPPGGSRRGTGLRYWTMGVDDIEAAVAKCEAAGAPIPLGVTQLAPGIRIAMIEDPEGNVVEFLDAPALKMTRDLPAEGLVERVRGVTPLIASTSFEAEAQRRPLDAVIEALQATGVFRSFVPARYGGYEIDMSTYVDIGLAVAHADPSMGWVTTFYMEHNWLLSLFAEELQDEIFGTQPFVLAPGTVNPSGRAVPRADGTYALSGHWQFATGICHADWVLLSGTVDGDETGTARQFLVTVDDVVVKDTWFVDGMVATGSHDVVASDVTVPAHRVSLAPPPHLFARPGDPYLLRIPIMPFLSLTAAIPAVGAATRALELFEELIFERIQFGTRRTQNNRVPTQVRLANLRVEVDFAETLLRDIATRIQAHADGAIDFDLPAQQQLRLALAHVVRRCRDAIREILASSGASAHYLDHELQRLHRDIHMISAHTVFDVDLVAEGVGRAIVAARVAAAGAD